MTSVLYLDHGVGLGDSSVTPSSEDQVAPQEPVKKVTRQWAAWTRSEEESFFAALRQVGKNFEKITSHVQSKNKDQVRHYYYRLVRRMNKMLDPELCLDAKNSRDTVAAMLRWWSLVEKYRCKASKLHLKPRRLKLFVEALENQLLKDRKKKTRKRLATRENNSSVVHKPVLDQVGASGHDNRAAKVVLIGRQNIPIVGKGKRSLPTRRINFEADPTTVKTARKRRKLGLKSTAEYKRLETAATAGVSLVADTAEYLERLDTSKETEHVQEMPGHDCSQHVTGGARSSPIPPQSALNYQISHNSGKLKLQLFPIDEFTRKALETGNHNPHLELTLSTRKKISSVLEHLNHKWGNSSLLSQELVLFPYWALSENLLGTGYQKWTKDSPLCAADIYNLVGSPPVFRLRYGWFSKAEVEYAATQAVMSNNLNVRNSKFSIGEEQNVEIEYRIGHPINTNECGGSVSDVGVAQYHDNPAFESSLGTQHGALAVTRHFETKETTLVAGEWDDSITNISVGDLLSESPLETDIIHTPFPVPVSSNYHEQIPFSCDSFDGAISAFLCKHQNEADIEQSVASHGPPPSIWDADETCDAFSFQRNNAVCDKVEELLEEGKLQKNTPASGYMNSSKGSGGLTGIYWSDSLGPLDLEAPSCGNINGDLILSDSLGGLNSLLPNIFDVFQSCSLSGLDKIEPASTTAESLQTAPFSDFRISSQV